MTVGTSATLIPIRHDWSSPVEKERAFPGAVLGHRDGSEQRLALSHLSTDTVTYRLLAPSSTEAVTFVVLPELATNAWVRVPRWEDESRVSAAVSAGSAVSIPCDTTDKPTFAANRQVILWRSASSYEVTTATAVTSSTVTADLTSSWAPGTIIAPVMPGRLVLPLSLSQWLPTTGALQCVVAFNLGDIAGVGTGGSSTTGTPYAMTITGVVVPIYGRSASYARVTDVVGNVLTNQAIGWATDDATNAPVHATPDKHVAIVGNPNGLTVTSKTLTATLGALTATATVSFP